MIQWRAAAGALADSLVGSGAIRDLSWRAVFADTPRHVFVPRYWDTDDDGGLGEMVDGSDSRQRRAWLATVYSDRSLATGWATVTAGGAALRVVSAAALAPGAAAVLLDRLELRRDHRVLEIGTGAGYLTALLAAGVGAERVTSIDADPAQLARAAGHLCAIGHRPRLAVADLLEGWPVGAPYDRIVLTGSIGRVPPAWIRQLAVGGRIVIPLHVGDALAVLGRMPSLELSGRIDSRAVEVLPLRAAAGVGSPATVPRGDAQRDMTSVSPSVLSDPEFRFWLSLHVPGVRILDARSGPHDVPIATLVFTRDGRAMLGHRRTGQAGWPIVQQGRQIWTSVEAAVRAYQRAGRPRRNRLGVTIRVQPPEQTVWLDSPYSTHRWPLPDSGG